jgi:hypothetical protein
METFRGIADEAASRLEPSHSITYEAARRKESQKAKCKSQRARAEVSTRCCMYFCRVA